MDAAAACWREASPLLETDFLESTERRRDVWRMIMQALQLLGDHAGALDAARSVLQEANGVMGAEDFRALELAIMDYVGRVCSLSLSQGTTSLIHRNCIIRIPHLSRSH